MIGKSIIALTLAIATIPPAISTATAGPPLTLCRVDPEICLHQPPPHRDLSHFASVEVYTLAVGVPDKVWVSDVSLPSGGLTGGYIGSATFLGSAPQRAGYFGYQYSINNPRLVSGHHYDIEVERGTDNLGDEGAFAASPGPWNWTFTELPPPILK
jgi:hypothetical protein